MKKPYLVAYDYGQGAVWAFLLAASEEDIRNKFPELVIASEPPSWMSAKDKAALETIDLDHTDGTWLAIPQNQKTSQ